MLKIQIFMVQYLSNTSNIYTEPVIYVPVLLSSFAVLWFFTHNAVHPVSRLGR